MGWATRPLQAVADEVRTPARYVASETYELWSVPSYAAGRPEHLLGAQIGSTKHLVRPEDVLLCKINPRINRVWRVSPPLVGVTQLASPEWIVLRVKREGGIQPAYLQHYLRSPEFRRRIEATVHGVTGSHTRAQVPQVMQVPIPVPSFDEQRRIVDILEDHLSHLDTAEEGLARDGRRLVHLSEAWLREHLPIDPPLRERYSIQDALIDSRGGWSRSRNHLVEPSMGVPYLKMNNITRSGVFDLTDLAYIAADPAQRQQYGVREGDVLFNSKNSGDLIGKTAVADARVDGWLLNENIMRLRFDQRLLPQFLGLWFRGPSMRRQILSASSASTNVAAVYMHALKDFVLWIPQPDVQEHLVAAESRLAADVRRLTEALETATRRSSALRRALLAAAFSGRLTGRSSDLDIAEELMPA